MIPPVPQPSEPPNLPPRAGPLPPPDSVSESTVFVLDRARSGDRSAVRVLIARALPDLRKWSRGRIPSYGRGPSDTEDMVQDAVVRTLARLTAFEPRSVSALQAYLRRTVMNSVRDVVRRVRRRGLPSEASDNVVSTQPSPLEQAIKRQSAERFLAALQRLRPVDRQAVIWRIELDRSYNDIAMQLGKPTPAAARMAVKRALERLAKELGIESES